MNFGLDLRSGDERAAHQVKLFDSFPVISRLYLVVVYEKLKLLGIGLKLIGYLFEKLEEGAIGVDSNAGISAAMRVRECLVCNDEINILRGHKIPMGFEDSHSLDFGFIQQLLDVN